MSLRIAVTTPTAKSTNVPKNLIDMNEGIQFLAFAMLKALSR